MIKFSVKLFFTIVLIAGFVYFGLKYVVPQLEHKDRSCEVTRVFDGDTFEAQINGRREKIRMLGIDAPEKFDSDKLDRDIQRTGKDKETIRKLGELSSQYVTKLLEGKKVRLESDPINDDRDKYGRLLRYVYLEDGTFVNKKIVEAGYANAYTRFPLSKKDEIIQAEHNARENKRGLWGEIEGLKYMGEN